MSLGLELIWETAWPIFLNFCIESFNQIIRNTAKRIFEKRSLSFKNRQKLRFLAIFGVFGKISRKRLQRFFRFYAWSSCPIVGRNWRSQISQEKSGSFKNGPNVVKNDGFSPLLTICAHVWHFSSSEMDIQAYLIILHKLDEKECHFLADFAFWLQSICEKRSKWGKIQCFLIFD